jgi:ABC-type Mn2+/Zn2+ transport system ATPase subunit
MVKGFRPPVEHSRGRLCHISERKVDTTQPLIKVDQAVFGYGGRAVVCVDHLELSRGQCLGIFGPNGSGKTTLVRGITGLLPPMAGYVSHTPAADASPGEVLSYRHASLRIGYLPQHRNIELHWPMTALDAASLAISARRLFGWIGPKTADVLNMMRRLKIDALAPRPFASLSGGQQQRVLLSGALAGEPTVLVLDEPTEGLDVRSTQELLDLLREFIKEGLAMMIISHEADDLMQVARQIAWLHPAQQYGDPSTVEIVTPEALGERILQSARRVG